MRKYTLHLYIPPEAAPPYAEFRPDGGEGRAADAPPDAPPFHGFGAADPMTDASAPQARALPRLLRDRVRARLLDAAEANGADRDAANRVLAELEGERPILEWLLDGGWEKLLALVLELLKFAA